MTSIPGIVASNGIAIGPAFVYRPAEVEVVRTNVADRAAEGERFDAARGDVRAVLEGFAASFVDEGRSEEAEIFEIQLEFLDDPTFGEAIAEMIADEGINAEAAADAVTNALVAEFSEIEDEYFAQRTADIEDLGRRLIRTLAGFTDNPFAAVSQPVIVLARDLAPSDTASMDRTKLLALCTEVGSATSHTAILSRSLGIPALVGTGPQDVEDGALLIVDAVDGELLVDPDESTVARFRTQKNDLDARRDVLLASASEPAVTKDGVRVEVVANIGSVDEAGTALECGAEGVGLLRTEFLFLERRSLPDEEEQYAQYRQIADIFGTQPVVVRTLDVGGDKQLPSVETAHEDNPFLGQRAIRLALAEPERLLLPQVKALLRAGVQSGVRIMFPMVATTGEVRELRTWVERARADLDAAGVAYAPEIEIGIMIEIPAAAVSAKRLAPLVDFFSIGTNDLTQYTLAVDRTNERVAPLADYFDPAVLDLIGSVIAAGHEAGKWVGMCGEMAGDLRALPLLLGMGLDEFSMAPSAIPAAKDRLRSLESASCRALVEEIRSLDNAADIRTRCDAFLAER